MNTILAMCENHQVQLADQQGMILNKICENIQQVYYQIEQIKIYKYTYYQQQKVRYIKMNILSNMDQIADIIIRPSRYLYKPVDLGPKLITVNNKTIYHHDFEVKNSKGLILKASLYTEHDDIKNIKTLLIYLHCNSGCRIQGLAYMRMAIMNEFSYVVFDFSGSGLSQGKHVSLGYYQAEDIKSIVKYLKKRISFDIKIVLWGRSMGAVAALRYLPNNYLTQNILVAVFDSPFQSLKQLFLEIGKQKTNLPKIVLEVALKYLKPIIQNKANFDIDQVNICEVKQISSLPAVFIASKKDSLIPFSQMDNIFKQYKGPKEMLFVEQSHNEPRNANVIKQVFSTVKKFILSQQTSQVMFRSQLPTKDQSRQKLQLTIKSFSQKNLLFHSISSETPRAGDLKQISFPQLQKRQISCLFQKRKKAKNLESPQFLIDNERLSTSSQFKNKKKQIVIRKFFKDQNSTQISIQKPNLIRFKSQKQCGQGLNTKSRDQQRKTMQHIANKKPPYIDNQRLNQFRNSLQSKYRTQYRRQKNL